MLTDRVSQCIGTGPDRLPCQMGEHPLSDRSWQRDGVKVRVVHRTGNSIPGRCHAMFKEKQVMRWPGC